MPHDLRIDEGLFQSTVDRTIHLTGVGLHSGASVRMAIAPAPVDSGIVFIRSDRRAGARIPALWSHVVDTRMHTVLGNAAGTTLGTVEHLMAALWGCGIDNAEISVDGPEVAIMDGSAEPFVAAILDAGIEVQDAPRRAIRVLKPVTVTDGVKSACLLPGDGSAFSFEIDFETAAIRRQTTHLTLTADSFRREIGRARTFGFLHEVEALRSMGLARGGSLDNAVVVSGDTILNQDGLRYADEFVRHKVLDAIGDLYLAGAPIIGRFHGVRSGHALNNQLLHALFADRTAWCHDAPAALLPSGWCAVDQRAVA